MIIYKKFFNSNKSLASNIADIKGHSSLINLPSKYVVWSEDIREGSEVFRHSVKTFETNFV